MKPLLALATALTLSFTLPTQIQATNSTQPSSNQTSHSPAQQTSPNQSSSQDHNSDHLSTTLLSFAVILLAAKIGGAVEKFSVPRVLGELTTGVALSILALTGLSFLEAARSNDIIIFLAELGAIILLFEIGLESNIKQLIKVGPSSIMVALIGAIAPFVLGTFIIGPWLFPEHSHNAHLFIGATLVATSVGISASIFQNLGKTKTRAFQTFLGATLTDDILGLITLAIVSSIATGGQLSSADIGLIITKALTFLASAVIIGSLTAPYISKFFSKIHSGTGMKLGLAFFFALLFAYLATLVGLAPIIGAFAAGLILDAVHFQSFDSPSILSSLKKFSSQNLAKTINKKDLNQIINHAKETHIEDMISSLSLIFVPVFFTYTGLLLDARALLNPQVYIVAITITILAVLAKVIGGLAAKGSLQEKLLVGFAMVPRGEVGLIFATMGKTLGVFDNELFSAMVMVTFLTTFAAILPIKHFAGSIKVHSKQTLSTPALA